MWPQSAIYLKEALVWRVRAQQLRHLFWGIADKEAIETLRDYADELESKAAQLEARAERIVALEAEMQSEIAQAEAAIGETRAVLGRGALANLKL